MLRKHGSGEVLPSEKQVEAKTGSSAWTRTDQEELDRESEEE